MHDSLTRPPPARLAATLLASLGAIALATFVYAFFATAGFSERKLPEKAYHSRLSDAFLHGQLHLLEMPSKALLAQRDPYDFKTSRRLWRVWDASLYDGKYYFYWGPIPALIASGVKLIAGRDVVVTDRRIVTVSMIARVVVGAGILALALRSLFPTMSPWQLSPALLLWALASPYPYVLGRPGVYEAAIESAQAFLLLGVLFGLVAVRRGARVEGNDLLLVATGASWAAAVGCRVSLLFAVIALVASTTLVLSFGADRPWRKLFRRGGALALPLAAMLLALAAYNYARFGSFFDFGTDYMLTGRRFAPLASYVLPNLHSYLFRQYTVTCEFPFIGAPFFAQALTPTWVSPASGWVPQEPVVGLFVAIPGLAFSAIALGSAVSRFRRATSVGPDGATDRVYVWIVASSALVWLLAALPTLGIWTATIRYQSDVTSGALLLAILGFWSSRMALREHGFRLAANAVTLLAATLALYSVCIGLALGFQGGYYRVIKAHNPSLHEKLVRTFSLCDRTDAPIGLGSAKTRGSAARE